MQYTRVLERCQGHRCNYCYPFVLQWVAAHYRGDAVREDRLVRIPLGGVYAATLVPSEMTGNAGEGTRGTGKGEGASQAARMESNCFRAKR
jgi:hypothetical protein